MKKTFRVFVFILCVAALGAGLFIAWLAYTPSGARYAISQLSRATLGSKKVSWDKLEGSLARGISVQHLQVRDIPQLPSGSFLRVQTLSVRLSSPALTGLSVDVDNARIFLRGDEPIIVNAKVRGNSFIANAYTHSLDLGDVRDILTKFFEVPPMKGILRDIDFFAGGSFERPWVAGHLIAERIVRNEFVLEECPLRADLRFIRGGAHWETHGRLDLLGGWLLSPVVRIDILESRLTFSGRPSRPELDINATARVARTKIDIRVYGTRVKPQLLLTSDDPYPQEQLLLMIATGRRWSGLGGAAGGNTMTPQIASSFVDYLLFGGSRGKVVEWFGLNDISLIADEKARGVSLSKAVTDKLGVGYGVKVGSRSADRARSHAVTQTLEGDYRLTDRLTVSAQKELKTARQADRDTIDPTDLPDDRIFLRYRSHF